MRSLFYPKLAWQNLGKNRRSYISYMITCVITIAMFYIISALAQASQLDQLYGIAEIRFFLQYGQWIIGIFAVIFLFYTHSFIVKRRKKEFGLYNILGMEKRHIALVLLYETLYCAGITILLGLFFGVVLYRAALLLLMKLLHAAPEISGGWIFFPSIRLTILFFLMIFALTFLNTLRQIRIASPIELLKGSNVGEKEPKARILMVIAGLLCLGGGYYISVTATEPLQTVALFFLAVILVVVGTYLLFTSITIAVLKLLRKNKKYYYKPNHFTFISGMLYRMKQNAVGLANICILSTMVLVMISTSFLLYLSIGDQQRTNYPRNILVDVSSINLEDVPAVEEYIDGIVKEQQIQTKDLQCFSETSLMVLKDGNHFYGSNETSLYTNSTSWLLLFLPLEDYNRITGDSLTLENANDIYICPLKETISDGSLIMDTTQLNVKGTLDEFEIADSASKYMVNTCYIIAKDRSAIRDMTQSIGEVYGLFNTYFYTFDLDGDDKAQIAVKDQLHEAIFNSSNAPAQITGYVSCVAESTAGYYQLYGGLLFIGLFLGILFLMATVLIIYYKQMTEGYEDRERFQIMQKVGMSRKEVKSTITTQVLSVFFLPLAVACIHTGFAFPIISRLLALLQMFNTTLFIIGLICTIGVFALFYTIIYMITARLYYKIVSV